MKSSLSFFAAPSVAGLALLLCTGALHAATLISVDFGGGTAQSGFQTLNTTADGPGPVSKSFTISDTVSVPTGTLTATLGGGTDATNLANDIGALNSRLRPSPTNSGSFTYADLLNDRIVTLSTGTGAGLFLQLSGLQPNTSFTVQVYGYDNAKAGNVAVLDRTNGASSTLGSYTVTAGQLPTDNNSFSITGTVSSDATGKLVVQSVSNIDGGGIMNGFVLSTVPEPGTAALLGLSALPLLARRRRA